MYSWTSLVTVLNGKVMLACTWPLTWCQYIWRSKKQRGFCQFLQANCLWHKNLRWSMGPGLSKVTEKKWMKHQNWNKPLQCTVSWLSLFLSLFPTILLLDRECRGLCDTWLHANVPRRRENKQRYTCQNINRANTTEQTNKVLQCYSPSNSPHPYPPQGDGSTGLCHVLWDSGRKSIDDRWWEKTHTLTIHTVWYVLNIDKCIIVWRGNKVLQTNCTAVLRSVHL